MKKLIALVLAVLCLGSATAFAAGPSVTKTEPVPNVAVFDKIELSSDEVLEEHLMSKIALTAPGKANKLEEADKKAFLDEYNSMKDVKDGKVLSCFFCAFKKGQEVTLEDGQGFKITFSVKGVKEGDNVVVRLNGKELAADKVEVGNGKVTVIVTELGVFSIIKK